MPNRVGEPPVFETPQYLYQEIAESFRRRIASGELEPGDRLPPVRKLASTWSCTPGTVSRAYRVLVDEGLIISQRGKGTRVAPNVLQLHNSKSPQGARGEELRWARLVNRAEQFLLEGVGTGFSGSEVQAALTVALSRWRQRQTSTEGQKERERNGNRLQFSGSHDLVVEHVAAVLKGASPAIEMEMNFTGSLGGLMALLRAEANVAGCHLWDEETDSFNVPYVQRLLPGVQVVMMTLVHRSLGLMLRSNSDEKVRSLADVARGDVQIINRQRGSGTRMWLDAQLRRKNIDAAQIAGYENEVTTHVAVAQRIADGQADAGPGIYAAAAAYGLSFVPLAKERYDLVFSADAWETPGVEAIVEHVKSNSFKQSVQAMGGYDSSESGRLWRV